jgi:predicted ATPase
VPRRRDVRNFGPGPYLLGLRRDPEVGWGTGFPYAVPAVAAIEDLRLDRPVTLLAGDNGTGKSTIVEAIAEAIGFAP